ncbi:MAG: hypothetical protein QGF59_20530, partial [Pirellulaceae bacterium]|nr:hypothetical protein [Pirellulaceae bacterium]
GVATATTVDVAAGTVAGAYGTGGLVTVTYTTIESITAVAGASTNLAVTGSVDYTVNAGSETDQGEVLSGGVPISFDGFGAANSVQLTGTGAITVNGTTGDDVFTVTAASGDAQITGRALIERDGTSNTLNLNGHDGDDTFNVNAAQPYGNITLSGGNPGGSDIANLTGDGSSAATVTLEDVTSATAASVQGSGLGNISLPGIEHVNLSAQNDVTVNGTGADDDVTYTPTGAQSGTVTHGATNTEFNLTTVSNLTIDGQGGDNTLTVNGTTAANTFAVNGTQVLVAGLQGVDTYANSAAVTVNGLEGSDIFNVTPSAIPLQINGGDPTSVQPGDALNISDPVGVNVTFTSGPEPDSGSFLVGANAPVSFDEIESSTVTGAGGGGTTVTINGTNADDDITVLGTAGNSFNVSVNAGPAIQFNTIDGLTVNGMSGDDDIDVELNALDLLNDIAVNGQQPGSGDGDTLTVRGDVGADAPVWTPSASTLVVSGETINVGVIENLIYDGESETDALTITGDATNNAFAHTPAAARDAGTIDITAGAGTQLGIQYVNLGLASTVAFDGVAGTNTLIANGSNTDDVFDLTATSGDVNLTRNNGAHVVLTTATVANVTLNGLNGDDTFNVPGPQPYANIVLSGGDPSASDVANLTGDGTGPITVTVSSPATMAGGGLGAVSLPGIEHTNLNAAAANVDVNGDTGDDDIAFTTTGSDSGILTNAGLNNEFNLSQVGTLSVDGMGGDNT